MSGKVPASLFNWEDLLFSASLAFFSFFPSEQASGQTDRRAWAYCNQNQSYRNLPSTLYLHLSLRSIHHSLNPSPRIRKAIVHTRLRQIIVSFEAGIKKKEKTHENFIDESTRIVLDIRCIQPPPLLLLLINIQNNLIEDSYSEGESDRKLDGSLEI